MTDGIVQPDSFIVVPIGPTQAFFACRSVEMQNYLSTLRPEKLMAAINDIIAKQAARFVYGKDEKQKRFVENRLNRHPTQFIAGRAIIDVINRPTEK
jgi:hypothetical protein